ncbi:endonuclease/exonuclease/phosphatase family protein [Cellulomonas sp. URHD0024]|uniref:endonuclease/exonuclease/phosphatase family protein n=1 Tax=Cellulomonas sp. URHD0024 TaxID=1302620 RepID=UPI00055391FE|nr:endonuclease/exonuclease/phosphatase family protein [Cellulomonas sp. URHD0024]
MRVMTYNLKGLHMSARAAATVVRSAEPDVLAVQEPPRGLFGRARMRRFGRAVGMEPVVSGHGARTTALLVRDLPVQSAHAIRLSWRPGRTRRGVAVAQVDGITFVVVHFSLVSAERAAHLDRLLASVVPTARTVVLGDLNEQPAGSVWTRLTAHLGAPAAPTGPTFPSSGARQRIDAVFATPDLVVGPATVLDGPAVDAGSDHRPIVVDLR